MLPFNKSTGKFISIKIPEIDIFCFFRIRFQFRKNFYELLDELNNLDGESEWRKVKGSIESDKRYEVIGSSSKREQFFNEYIRVVIVRDINFSPFFHIITLLNLATTINDDT
jgi:FF domain.